MSILDQARQLVCQMNPHEAQRLGLESCRSVQEWPEWAQRVTNALVKAQLWVRENRSQTAELLSNAGVSKYTPHKAEVSKQRL